MNDLNVDKMELGARQNSALQQQKQSEKLSLKEDKRNAISFHADKSTNREFDSRQRQLSEFFSSETSSISSSQKLQSLEEEVFQLREIQHEKDETIKELLISLDELKQELKIEREEKEETFARIQKSNMKTQETQTLISGKIDIESELDRNISERDKLIEKQEQTINTGRRTVEMSLQQLNSLQTQIKNEKEELHRLEQKSQEERILLAKITSVRRDEEEKVMKLKQELSVIKALIIENENQSQALSLEIAEKLHKAGAEREK
ncbi:uncharacterized protein MONOS_17696 [Monocercomonoides exilis]|uniref:uncharacterized protein n=1 Tax=Monocercomonoides exilis TaxID=2049356 RepID=UPI0035594446|nr:hypothetical protein MONOS_17696 [Monocercomonoides exilis]